MSCDSDSKEEQVLVIVSASNIKEKLEMSVECTEANGSQDLVLTGTYM